MRSFRAALLASATFSAAYSTPALAACDLQTNLLDCSTTTTTNASHLAGPPSSGSERAWTTTSGGTFGVSVASGTSISGAGLSVVDAATGPNTVLTMINSGSVTASVSPAVQGDGALSLYSTNSANIAYNGVGDVANSANGGGLLLQTQGSGAITANVGGNISSVDGRAIDASITSSAATSDLILSTASGKTLQAGAYEAGIFAQNLGSGQTIVINNSAINSTPATGVGRGIDASSSGGAITVNNTGAIGSVGKPATSEGIYAFQSNASAAGAVAIQSTNAIYGAQNGITAVNLGSGDTSIATGGAIVMVNTAGAGPIGMNGIFAKAMGKLTINVNGGIAVDSSDDEGLGVYAWSAGGKDMVLNLDNNVSANGALGQAVYARNEAGGTQTIKVTGTLSAGDAALHSNSDTARSITVGSGGALKGQNVSLALSGTGAATVTANGTIGVADDKLAIGINEGAALNLTTQTVGTIRGTLALQGGADSFVNGGTWYTKGSSDFGAGNDTLTNNALISLSGNATFLGLETFNQQGLLRLNSYTLTGSGLFTNKTNATIDTDGSAGLIGYTGLVNDGIIDLGAGTFTSAGSLVNNNVIFADEGAMTLAGQEAFANAGKVTLVDNAVGDVLTINSSYVGNAGARLMIDASDTAADKLVVTGGISGSTALDVNLIGTGTLVAGGILVVDGQSTASANAFVIGNVEGGNALAQYTIRQAGADFFLDALLLDTAFAPVVAGLVAGEAWYQAGDVIAAQQRLPQGEGRKGVWGQVYAGHGKRGGTGHYQVAGTDYAIDERRDTDGVGVQLGYGLPLGGATVGLTAGYERAKFDNVDIEGKLKGWNAGAYALFGDSLGLHGSALAKIDRFSSDTDVASFGDQDGRSVGVDGEIGYGFSVRSITLDASAGLSRVWTRIDDVSAGNLDYDYGTFGSTRGRVGVRATFSGKIAPFVSAQLRHEFDGTAGRLTLTDTIADSSFRIDPSSRATWGRIEAGIGGPADGVSPSLSGWVDVGDVRGLGARAGIRF